MRKAEQLLWDAMKRHLPERHWLQRIENLFGEGMPDVYCGARGKWIELKAPPCIPKRADTPLLGDKYGLRISQKNWLLKNCGYTESAPAYVLIRTRALELFLVPGHFAAHVNKMTLDELRARFSVTWDEVSMELTK